MVGRRVVVTGLGALTPIGDTAEETWRNLVAGVSGVQAFPTTFDLSERPFDISSHPTRIGAPIKAFDPARYMDPKEARRMARFSQLAVAATKMAVVDAGVVVTSRNAERVGVVLANGVGALGLTERNYQTLRERGPRRIHPLYVTMVLPNMASAAVSVALGATGYNTTVVTACAGGTMAIGEATNVIRRGAADVVVAGGVESALCEMMLTGFSLIGALSTRNEAPEQASRPFDAERDGLVPGEGAAILVLEALDHASARGARVLAEVLGYGVTCDAHHATAPEPSGAAASRAMQLALEDAGVPADGIDCISAHATSTPLGDKLETVAIKRTFGKHAYRVPISANKAMTGHMFAASGAVEALAAIMALEQGVIPPTINQEHPDPDCDLDYVPNRARRQPVGLVLSNSFGFGGQNACLVLGRPPGAR